MSEESKENDEVVFNVTSNFGHRTRQPFVVVTAGALDFTVQMSSNEARNLAMNLLACAEAAEGDGFLMTFLGERIGVEDDRALATVLMDFREYREKARAESEEGNG